MITLEQFGAALSQDPPAEELKTKSGKLYLPISFIENKLDEIFGFACWSYEFRDIKIVTNEIVGIVDLKVFHPIAKTWITRSGAASTMIQQVSGSDVSDVNAKIKNALEKGFPKLKSDCLKNAAKSIGKIFGRDLNRDKVDSYEEGESLNSIIERLENVQSVKELSAIKSTLNLNNPVLKSLSIQRFNQLSSVLQIEGGKDE